VVEAEVAAAEVVAAVVAAAVVAVEEAEAVVVRLLHAPR
jgi:hypothetical protein